MPNHASRTRCTIGDRLSMIRRRLIALHGTIRLVADPAHQIETGADDEELAAILLEDLRIIDDELTWLSNLPARTLSLPAPTDDEREEMESPAAVQS